MQEDAPQGGGAGPSATPEVKAENNGTAEDKVPMSTAEEDALLEAFFSDLKDVDRDNEVNRILWAFKLNPFEKLNLRFDCTMEEVNKAYRKMTLMVHPDKCKHPQASAAFDLLGDARKELIDEEKRTHLLKVLDAAKEEVRKERKKETKHDNLVRVASLLNEEGRAGVEAEWEKTDEFHEKWKLKAREVLASMEWRKRKLNKRLKEETARIEGVEKEAKEQHKKAKQAEKEWEANREQRVGTWRDFIGKKDGKTTTGEFKPPKARANDEDKLYVRRPVKEEEMRPATKGNKTQGQAQQQQQQAK